MIDISSISKDADGHVRTGYIGGLFTKINLILMTSKKKNSLDCARERLNSLPFIALVWNCLLLVCCLTLLFVDISLVL